MRLIGNPGRDDLVGEIRHATLVGGSGTSRRGPCGPAVRPHSKLPREPGRWSCEAPCLCAGAGSARAVRSGELLRLDPYARTAPDASSRGRLGLGARTVERAVSPNAPGGTEVLAAGSGRGVDEDSPAWQDLRDEADRPACPHGLVLPRLVNGRMRGGIDALLPCHTSPAACKRALMVGRTSVRWTAPRRAAPMPRKAGGILTGGSIHRSPE